jgi:hypothetical protein
MALGVANGIVRPAAQDPHREVETEGRGDFDGEATAGHAPLPARVLDHRLEHGRP